MWMKLLDKSVSLKLRSAVLSSPDREVCGFVLEDGEVFICRNTAEDPASSFVIEPEEFEKASSLGQVLGIFHSHISRAPYLGVTATDLESQEMTGLPWAVLFLFNGYVSGPYWWGAEYPLMPLIGREFILGIADCYCLCRDFYKVVYNLSIPSPPAREGMWWESGIDLISPNLEKHGAMYDEVSLDSLQPGDMLVGRALSRVLNHFAIYLGDGLILHHLSNRLSSKTALGPWRRNLFKAIRPKDIQKLDSREILSRIEAFDRRFR